MEEASQTNKRQTVQLLEVNALIFELNNKNDKNSGPKLKAQLEEVPLAKD